MTRQPRSLVAYALGSAIGLAGCFYTEQINQRPSIDISAAGQTVYRGDHVELTAVAEDPEGQFIEFGWRAYACTDGSGGAANADCDQDPFYTGSLQKAAFTVPLVRLDRAVPVKNVRVVLEAKDELGATAKPSQELVIVTLDRPPDLELRRDGSFVPTPGRALDLYAVVGDADDGPAGVAPLVWEVFSPGQVAHTLVDGTVTQNPNDPAHRTYRKVFTPGAVGDWEIRVTATDPIGTTTQKSVMMTVVPPPPPCIAQLQPIAPTGGAALPITDPTLLRVPVVVDDLDVYPPQPGDLALGITRFQWSVQAPGNATHLPVAGATSNAFTIDPASYVPGDIVEVRVEIYDRQNTAIPCVDSEATCSTISQTSCLQRQTWRLEVR